MHMHASVSLFVLCKRDLTWFLVDVCVCVLFIIMLCERNTGLTIWSAFTKLYNTSANAWRRPFFPPMVRVGLLFDLRHCDTQPRGISHGCGLSERLVKKTHHWSGDLGESPTENPSIPVRISQINKFKLYRSTPGVWKAASHELCWRTQFWWEQLIENQSLVRESKVILCFGLCLSVWVSCHSRKTAMWCCPNVPDLQRRCIRVDRIESRKLWELGSDNENQAKMIEIVEEK